MFDLVIRQVRIIDGTGSPWTVGDVAVQDGKIAAMGRHVAGGVREVIDGKGLTLTPGFIDIHTHSDFSLLLDGSAPAACYKELQLKSGATAA